MAEVGYLPDAELANIPQVDKKGSGVLYGPLVGFPLVPDCAAVWVNPAQAMVLSETLDTTTWKPVQDESVTLFGRPACAAVARSMNSEREALSLGCVGMRTLTAVAPALALLAMPGLALTTLAARLHRIQDANDKMRIHYQAKKDAFE